MDGAAKRMAYHLLAQGRLRGRLAVTMGGLSALRGLGTFCKHDHNGTAWRLPAEYYSSIRKGSVP